MSTPCLLSLWRTRAELDGDTGDLDEDTGIVSASRMVCVHVMMMMVKGRKLGWWVSDVYVYVYLYSSIHL